MTATDELRRLLDERGVKWDYGITGATSTRFSANGVDVTFVPMRYGLICSTILTPAQVVKVMLGRGECKIEHRRDGWYCTGCGDLIGSDDPDSELFIDGNVIETWDYCPSCGRKVKR